MAGIALADRHHGDAIGTGLGRQPEIGNLRELLDQQRGKHIVERLAEHAGLVGRTAGKGRQIDRVFPHGDGAGGKDREFFGRVVIAGVIAIGSLIAELGQ